MSDVIKFDSGRCAQLVSQLIRVRGSLENANYSIGQVSRNPLYNIHNCNLYRDIEAVNNCIAALQQIIGLMESTESNLARYEIPHQNVGVNVNVDVRGGTGDNSDASSQVESPGDLAKLAPNSSTGNSDGIPPVPPGVPVWTEEDFHPNSNNSNEYNWGTTPPQYNQNPQQGDSFTDNVIYYTTSPFYAQNWETDGGVSGPSVSSDDMSSDGAYISIFDINGNARFHDDLGYGVIPGFNFNYGGFGFSTSYGSTLFQRTIEAEGDVGLGVGYGPNGGVEGGNASVSVEASSSAAALYQTTQFTTPIGGYYAWDQTSAFDVRAGGEISANSTSEPGANIDASACIVSQESTRVYSLFGVNLTVTGYTGYGVSRTWEWGSTDNGFSFSGTIPGWGPVAVEFGISTGEVEVPWEDNYSSTVLPPPTSAQQTTPTTPTISPVSPLNPSPIELPGDAFMSDNMNALHSAMAPDMPGMPAGASNGTGAPQAPYRI